MNTKLSKQKGFTIIEVLIVLAIAGLIMLIVFLAVPALQRNSRNTSYRNEAARLLTAATENIANSNGSLPTASTCDETSATATSKCSDTTALNDAKKIWQLAGKPANIKIFTIVNASSTAITPTLSASTLDTAAECPATVSGTSVTPVTAGAAPRGLALIYAVEDSKNDAIAQCQNS